MHGRVAGSKATTSPWTRWQQGAGEKKIEIGGNVGSFFFTLVLFFHVFLSFPILFYVVPHLHWSLLIFSPATFDRQLRWNGRKVWAFQLLMKLCRLNSLAFSHRPDAWSDPIIIKPRNLDPKLSDTMGCWVNTVVTCLSPITPACWNEDSSVHFSALSTTSRGLSTKIGPCHQVRPSICRLIFSRSLLSKGQGKQKTWQASLEKNA
jgi:hypothetical protein